MGSKRLFRPVTWPSWILLPIGVAALWLDFSIVVGSMLAGVGEPYADLETYLSEALNPAVGTLLFFLPLLIVVIGIGALYMAGFRSAWRLFAVEAAKWIVPLAIWAFAFMFHETTDPTLNLGIPPPAWTSWFIFAILGAPSWLLIFMYFAGRNLYRELKSLRGPAPQPAVA
jgi:hypothetical protein